MLRDLRATPLDRGEFGVARFLIFKRANGFAVGAPRQIGTRARDDLCNLDNFRQISRFVGIHLRQINRVRSLYGILRKRQCRFVFAKSCFLSDCDYKGMNSDEFCNNKGECKAEIVVEVKSSSSGRGDSCRTGLARTARHPIFWNWLEGQGGAS